MRTGMTYTGTHGTSVHRASIIERDGFTGRAGRGGTGVYLWRQSEYAFELAAAWYRFRNAKDEYHDEPEQGGVVLIADVLASEDEHMDLEAAEVKDRVAELAIAVGISDDSEEDIAAR
jgi:hypothetical protein